MSLPVSVRYALLTLSGLAVLALGLAVAFHFPRRAPNLAEVLPAAETLLFWEEATFEDLAPWAGRFPALAALPPSAFPHDGALVQTGPDTVAWILIPDSRDALAANAHPIPEFALPVILSSREAAVISRTGPRLADDPGFALLRGPGVFARASSLSPGDTALTRLLAIFGGVTAPDVAIRRIDRGLTVSWLQAEHTTRAGAPSSFVDLSPTPAFTLSAGHLGRLLQELPPGDVALRRAALASRLAEAAGDSASWEYDVLPLISGAGVVHLRRDAETGRTLLLLEGYADARVTERTLSRLHEGAAAQLHDVSVVERTHEGEVVGRSVTAGDRAVTASESRDGWEILQTSPDGARGLFTARRGGMFIATTDQGWFGQRLSMASTATFPQGGGTLLAAGRADRAVLTALAGNPDTLPGLLLPLLPTEGAIRWGLGASGPVRSLTAAW